MAAGIMSFRTSLQQSAIHQGFNASAHRRSAHLEVLCESRHAHALATMRCQVTEHLGLQRTGIAFARPFPAARPRHFTDAFEHLCDVAVQWCRAALGHCSVCESRVHKKTRLADRVFHCVGAGRSPLHRPCSRRS